MDLGLLLVVLVSVWSVSGQHLHYVLPDGSSPLNCPAQPCLILDQYTRHTGTYFTTGSTFLFLAGNHSLQATVTLTNISDLTLRGEGNDSQVNIICKNGVTIQCDRITNLKIEKLTFLFYSERISTSVNFSSSNNVIISNCAFQGNEDLHKHSGRAITLLTSSAKIVDCVFNRLSITGDGGAMHARKTNLTVSGSSFFRNRATGDGGAMHAENIDLTLRGNKLIGNSARNGGAINVEGRLIFEEQLGNVFAHNLATHSGGAIYCNFDCTINETRNCTSQMDARYDVIPQIDLVRCLTSFYNNTSDDGGAIYSGSFLSLNATSIMFFNNKAHSNENSRGSGGAISSGGNLDLSGLNILFQGNKASSGGGAIHTHRNVLLDGRNVEFKNNMAQYGGALVLAGKSGLLSTATSVKFINNTAETSGGALHADYGAAITLNNEVNFTSNTAQKGGAINIIEGSFLTLNHHTTLTTSHNHASLYGGAIYHEDNPTQYVCDNLDAEISDNHPECFLRLGEYESIHINSYFNSADRDGSFLYGGLLDKCRLSVDDTYNYSIIPYNFLTEGGILDTRSNHETKVKAITSEPYLLCFCGSDLLCHNTTTISISRGQKFIVSARASAQGGATSAQITALPGINARIHLNQVIQTVNSNCTTLEYNFHSSQDHNELRLTTRGSCGETKTGGRVEVVARVTMLPCPRPFIHNNEDCACDKRLLEYPNVNCTTDEFNNSYVTKKSGTDFWMSVSYDSNGSYKGLILYKTCPPQYCKTQTDLAVSLDDLDSQCDDNRGGVLCGQCLANYSLMLGSSKCRHCSNKHLALLLPFAAAGIALVVFLSFLRLTVATAMINSVILYANIIQANRNFIFPVNARNVLTVFTAWMNLDLGFETCFYDGMTAYAQTWLQFAFPLYVWILISFIILSSRYSITVSKLIGHNPIAVLATLLLMSYTKLLKIIIEVYSSVVLDYPGNRTVTVWLKDANVPYLESWHLLLTVVTTLVLVLFFLPYTLLLLLGYKLYRFSRRKYFRWFHRMRPLLESYYTPYKIHTRYWAGFLLLVRCILYIIFSFYSLENTNKSLLAINITFTTLLVLLLVLLLCFSHQLYTKLHNNMMEISIYLNLIVISAATLAGVNSPALVYSLVGLVFVTMLGIIVYHFHLLYIVKSQVWQQFKVKVSALKEKLTHSASRTAAGPPVDAVKSSQAPSKTVTHTEIKLSEPLL